MYCINCGVKLADTEEKCPLCGVSVYHPELHRPGTEPLYPRHRYPAPQAASRAVQIVVTTLMAIAVLITLYIDYQINAAVTWSGFAAGGIGLAYILLVLPFWFKRINPLLYCPGLFAAVALYLLYIAYKTEGSWFWGFALPVTAYVGVLVTGQVHLLMRRRDKALTIVGGGFIGIGCLMVLMEHLICTVFERARFVGWSVYPLISLVLLGAMLIFLAVNRRAREKMERKFFI